MDYISLVKESDIPKYGEAKLTFDNSDYYWNGTTDPLQYNKIIEGDFGFDPNKEIEVKSNFEDDNIQKIYWTVEGEPLRALNIIYST